MMKRTYILLAALLAVLSLSARQKKGSALAEVLKNCLQVEDVHPDSLYPNLLMLERQKTTCTDAVDRAVYAMALGKRYADHSWRAQSWDFAQPANPDSLQEWSQMDYYRASARNFQEVFSQADQLYATSVKDWLPLTKEGDAPYRKELLGVAWQTLTSSLDASLRQRLGLPDFAWMIRFYERKGDHASALSLRLDSLQTRSYPISYRRGGNRTEEQREALLALSRTYGRMDGCAEVYLCLSQLPDLTPQERRAYLQEGLSRFPKYARLSALKNALAQLSDPMLEWQSPGTVYPGRSYDWTFDVRNVVQVAWELYRLPHDMKDATDLKQVRANGTKVQEGTHAFRLDDPIVTYKDTLRWEAPTTEGYYALLLTPQVKAPTSDRPETMLSLFVVTKKKALYTTPLPDGSMRCEAVDAVSGKPLGCDCDADDVPQRRNYWNSRRDTTLHQDIVLFTDRAIYRPGQKVLVSGMVYNRQCWDYEAQEGKKVTLKWMDTNRKELKRLSLTTDAYGVFSAELALPADEVGSFQMTCGSARKWVRVEEYQRPTFEVTFDPAPALHYPTDSITLTGTARHYNGTPVREARLTGHYQWMPSRWCFLPNTAVYAQLDTLRTDSQGRFALRIPVSAQAESYRYGMWLRTYIAVTSADGETHEANMSLSLCTQKVRLQGSCNRLLNVNRLDSLTLMAYGSTEKEIEQTIQLALYKGGELLHMTTINANKPAPLSMLAGRQPGRYRWQAEAVLEGDTARWNYEFLLCDERADVLPVDTALWLYTPDTTFDPEHPAVLQIGSSLKDAYVYLTAVANDRLVADTVLCLNGVECWTIPYEARYGQSLTYSAALVRDERVYTHTTTFLLKQPDNRLRYRWNTFRDCLQPGQEETWTLTLTRPDGSPASASLMATMYDASLDVFASHTLRWRPSRSHYTNTLFWQWQDGRRAYATMALNMRLSKSFEWRLSTLNEDYFTLQREELYAGASPQMLAPNKLMAAAPTMTKVQSLQRLDEDGDGGTIHYLTADSEAAGENTETEEETEATAQVSMRENFTETAFFMPSLTTDAQGQVALRFTLPESLTRWHLTGFAHTCDMLTAELDEYITASKELMGELRLPPYLRQGDEAVLTAIINNVSMRTQKGRATLTQLDGATEKVLLRKTESFELASESERVFTFAYDVPRTLGSIICRWQVQGTDCSDGEQRSLPILNDKEWVTDTEALWLDKHGKQQILLNELAKVKGDSMRVTVEYTTHPIWVALKALPNMATPVRHDALSLAAAYYAVATTQWALTQVPSLADDSLFANKSLREEKLTEWLGKLRNLQRTDGSFSWFPGMPGSTYITTEVAMLLARLQAQTGSQRAKDVLAACLRYLQSRADDVSLHQLYVCGLTGTPLNKQERKYLDALPDEMKTWSREQQALAAIVLKQQGKEAKARRALQAVTHYIVSTPQRGAYIEYPEGSHNSIDTKLRVHTLLMEALRTVSPSDTLRLSGMRRWLLQQKRVQGWDTPVQCVDAVYALLQGSPSDLDCRAFDQLTLCCGKRLMHMSSGDARQGYVRQTFAVSTAPTALQVDKQSLGESWGAVYVESQQRIDEVHASKMGLGVRCEVPDTSLSVGPAVCVMKYVITADRDYEYVSLSVERPACVAPSKSLSGCEWQDGLCYYRTVRDNRTEYHFERLPRGTYVIEEPVFVQRAGTYSTGIATIRCEYAREFQGHTGSQRVSVTQ